jgi:hypothetical protein
MLLGAEDAGRDGVMSEVVVVEVRGGMVVGGWCMQLDGLDASRRDEIDDVVLLLLVPRVWLAPCTLR